MNNFKFKRNKIDCCNICLQVKEMTWDHIPPKGGIELTPMEINEVYKFMTNASPKPEISQNGVKYRFICKDCNSKLGRYYDAALNDFSISVGRFLKSKSNLCFPEIIKIKTRPKAIIKSLLGHIVAAKAVIDEVKLDSKIRNFIFDDSAKIDDDIKIFYWIYPYDCVVIMRDFAMPAQRNGSFSSSGFFQIIKYFPIAYIITDLESYEGLPELTKYKNYGINDEIELPIFLKRIEDYDWPERVENTNIVLASAETENGILAKPR
jgi:hypothetical protein